MNNEQYKIIWQNDQEFTDFISRWLWGQGCGGGDRKVEDKEAFPWRVPEQEHWRRVPQCIGSDHAEASAAAHLRAILSGHSDLRAEKHSMYIWMFMS